MPNFVAKPLSYKNSTYRPDVPAIYVYIYMYKTNIYLSMPILLAALLTAPVSEFPGQEGLNVSDPGSIACTQRVSYPNTRGPANGEMQPLG